MYRTTFCVDLCHYYGNIGKMTVVAIIVPQVRGEDSPEALVHHGTGGIGRGSDGLRAEESRHEGVDPGGRALVLADKGVCLID